MLSRKSFFSLSHVPIPNVVFLLLTLAQKAFVLITNENISVDSQSTKLKRVFLLNILFHHTKVVHHTYIVGKVFYGSLNDE